MHDISEPEWSDNYEKIILGPYLYLKNVPGKNLRALLIEGFNTILKVGPETLATVENVVSMLHTASLLIDDVEDNAELRRGRPASHLLFGEAQAINSSNYVMFLALREIQNMSCPEAVKIYTEELINLHRGQGLDLYWRETLTCPTEEEYISMVMNKTGGLYRLATRLMQSMSNISIDLVPFANLLGVLYQIQDDYLNLQSAKYSQNKGFCEDLTEGKFSFPIIHSVRSDPLNKEIINVLKQRTNDVSLKQYAVGYMEDIGSFKYTKQKIEEYSTLCQEELNKLRAEGYSVEVLEGILKKISSFDSNE